LQTTIACVLALVSRVLQYNKLWLGLGVVFDGFIEIIQLVLELG